MGTPLEVAAGAGVEVFIILLALGLLYRVWGILLPIPKRQVILVFQRGVLLKDGRLEKILDPGTHWISSKRAVLLQDMRSKPFQLASQELLTADGMGVRMSLSGEYRVSNLFPFVTESADSFSAFYLEMRQALRAGVSELTSDTILSGHGLLTARIRELLIPRGEQLGIELVHLEIWEAVPLGWLTQR